ncbi:MAG TPA: hypothetical protein VMC79_10670, partial [Rectinemataceae bacterium]|nr:hypothetical protein [Rectinemataceae bacterium]
MDLNGYIALSMRVLGDWRVIAAALGSIVVWALLRRVGVVYHYGFGRGPGRSALRAAGPRQPNRSGPG